MSILIGTRRCLLGARRVLPTDITGLTSWYKADAGTFQSAGGSAATADTDPVGQWQDQFGTNHLAQTTAGARPVLKTNVQNGLPAVLFEGVSARMRVTFTRNQPHTVLVVGRFLAADTNVLVDGATANTAYVYDSVGANNRLSIFGGTSVLSVVAAPANWFIAAGVYNGAASKIAVNGASPTAGSIGTAAAGGLTVGSVGGAAGTFFKNGYLGEVIVYSAALSDSDLAALAVYANGRWGVY